MAIDPTQLGLGAIQSPVDARDWTIDMLYAATGIDPVAASPATYLAPAPYPPVLNQGSSPKCVAFSNSTSKAYQDLKDQGLSNFDENLFFTQIGGTANGAVPRVALQQMLDHGYPVVTSGNAALHKILSYYSVPMTQAAIQSAIMSFGPVLVSLPWYNSWFRPSTSGILPTPDAIAGGHEIVAVGWDARGLHLRNSWGPAWGVGGDCFLPWSYLGRVWEVWKSVDVIEPKPKTYTLRIAAGSTVKSYVLSKSGCLTGTTEKKYAKSAHTSCSSPRIKYGCVHGQAMVVLVPTGNFADRWVRLGNGVTVTTA